MNIKQIYRDYKIMPNLRLHQLRVAAVATHIALAAQDRLNPLELHDIQAATLLHDMGNIIKFKLDLFPKFLEPQGLEYWEGVKQNFIAKYGNEEHVATYKIAQEIGISERAMQLLKSIGFSKAPQNAQSDDLAVLIVCYSDHRVSPDGITSLEERMQGGRARFAANQNISEADRKKYLADFNQMADAMRRIETKIFSQVNLNPGHITDSSVAGTIEKLKSFQMGQ